MDVEFVEWLARNSVPFVLVFTKTDKVTPATVQANIAAFTDRISGWFEKLPAIFTCSAMAKQGREELLGVIDEAMTAIEPAWESRHAGIRKLLIAEGHRRADGRRVLTFTVAETGADGEIGAVWQAHQQRAQPSLVSASAGLMTHHDSLRIVKSFYPEQRRRTSGDVFRSRLAQHQAFAAQSFDPRQFRPQCVEALAPLLRVLANELRRPSHQRLSFSDTANAWARTLSSFSGRFLFRRLLFRLFLCRLGWGGRGHHRLWSVRPCETFGHVFLDQFARQRLRARFGVGK